MDIMGHEFGEGRSAVAPELNNAQLTFEDEAERGTEANLGEAGRKEDQDLRAFRS